MTNRSVQSNNYTVVFALKNTKRQTFSFAKLIFHFVPKITLASLLKKTKMYDLIFNVEVQFLFHLCKSLNDWLSLSY